MRAIANNLPSLLRVSRAVSLGLVASLSSGTIYADSSSSEDEDRFAYTTIIDNRSILRSKKLHEWTLIQPGLSSSLNAGVEVAIILLKRSETLSALNYLAYINLLDLDGALSEAYTCAVLEKGERITPYLNKAVRDYKHGSCVAPEFGEMFNSSICGATQDVQTRSSLLAASVNLNKKCEQD